MPVLTVVFSLKTFAAAMLALWIGCAFDLAAPFWAVATVYIVAHPLTGAVTSKALYRFIGTMIGAVMSVVFVITLINAPSLLCVVISGWIGLCLTFSLYDRTPRSYVFMLAGYTTAIIAFQVVDAPATVFQTAIDRSQEIGIGILAAALVSRLVFPRETRPVLSAAVAAWLRDLAALATQTLDDIDDRAPLRRLERKLAADALALRDLTVHVGYDAAGSRALTRSLWLLQHRMTETLPVIATIADLRRSLIDANGGATIEPGRADAVSALAEMGTALRRRLAGEDAPGDATGAGLRRCADRIDQAIGASRHRDDILMRALAGAYCTLADLWEDCLDLHDRVTRNHVTDNGTQTAAARARGHTVHSDHAMAILSGIAAALATGGTLAFWIGTGWSDGGSAATIVAIFSCLFARADNPADIILKQCGLLVLVLVAAIVLNFMLLPLADNFLFLTACLGLFLVPLGTLIASPATAGTGITACVNLPYMLMLGPRLSTDFAAFANTNVAMIVGVCLAAGSIMAVRSVGALWRARHLARTNWRDLSRLADPRTRPRSGQTRALVARMIDRFGLIAPRLPILDAAPDAPRADILRDLRVAMQVASLKQRRLALSAEERRIIDRVLQGLCLYFREKSRGQHRDPHTMMRILRQGAARLARTGDSPINRRAHRALTILLHLFEAALYGREGAGGGSGVPSWKATPP